MKLAKMKKNKNNWQTANKNKKKEGRRGGEVVENATRTGLRKSP